MKSQILCRTGLHAVKFGVCEASSSSTISIFTNSGTKNLEQDLTSDRTSRIGHHVHRQCKEQGRNHGVNHDQCQLLIYYLSYSAIFMFARWVLVKYETGSCKFMEYMTRSSTGPFTCKCNRQNTVTTITMAGWPFPTWVNTNCSICAILSCILFASCLRFITFVLPNVHLNVPNEFFR